MAVNADVEILQAALIGLQHMLSQVEQKIDELRYKVGVPSVTSPFGTTGTPKKRNLTPEARERIAEAQRKRWAAYQESKQEKSAKSVANQKESKKLEVRKGLAVARKDTAKKVVGGKPVARKAVRAKKTATSITDQSAIAAS